jgi:hypothetical protein
MKQKIQQRKKISETSGFSVASDDSYYLYSSYIRTTNHTLTHGADYILCQIHPKEGMEFKYMKFITARSEHDGWVTIDLENNDRPEKQSLGIPMIPNAKRRFPFVLMDLSTLVLDLNFKLMEKSDHLADNGSATGVIPGWDCILELIRDETEKMLRFDELLEFEF